MAYRTYINGHEWLGNNVMYDEIYDELDKSLKESGIPKETLHRFVLKNYIANEKWQAQIKNSIIEYLKDDNSNWLVLSGKTGVGKTHLCVASFQYLIKNKYKKGQYISWNTFSIKMLALSKSTYTDNQEKFEREINDICNVDVLYIDDLFKLTNNKYGNDESVSLLYRIINNRYLDKNKITIISTELFEKQIKELDEAIWGRIHERCFGGKYWLTIANENGRNYRAKNYEG